MGHISNQSQTQMKEKPQPLSVSPSLGLLQRTCDCGGTPGIDDVCEECREKRLSSELNTRDQQNTSISTSIRLLAGHNLSRLPVHPNNSTMLQTKLVVNEPGDKYEQEADQVAERVMRSSESEYSEEASSSEKSNSYPIQHKHPQGEEVNRQPEEEAEREEDESLQAKTISGEKPAITPETQRQINSIRGNGHVLPPSYRKPMEAHLGHDFSQVKIHTDTHAAETTHALRARAYTIDQDIVFGAGQFAPETNEGKKLLAHELTHVVQQSPGRAMPQQIYRQSETQPVEQQTDIERRLMEETIQIAKSPTTFLRAAYIRKALEERKSRKHLLEVFNSAVQRITAAKGGDDRKLMQILRPEAQKVLQTVELEFIRDPQASTLDLLPGEKGQQYRNFLWGKNDYPGNKPLPGEQEDEQTKQLRLEHQDEAEKMAGALSEVRPQRRVNIGKAAVMTKSEFQWEYVNSQLETVPGQGNHRLNRYAKDSFIKMHADALQDGVRLVILASDRSPSKAKRNAARAGNPKAVAKFSAHTLGLAVDFKMSQGGQKFEEITTRPMSNVVGMHQSPVHKWLFLRGAAYGWYPYQREPWHWEYNPPGFREKFREDMQKDAAKSSNTPETPVLQRSANGTLPSQSVPQTAYKVLHSPGEPLHASTRAFMESRFGHDFSNVRVHTDARAAESARDVNAHAYTVGHNVVFGSGHYTPGTSRGNKLLAHELTHTVQQAGQYRKQSPLQRGISASVIQRKDDPKPSAPIFPTRFNTSEVETPPYPDESEERLDLLIKKRQEENLPSGTGKRLGKVSYANLPPKKNEQGTDANIERRAVKSALLYKITSGPEEWADREFRLRVPLEDGPVAYTYAMVILRFDKDRNVEATYAGSNTQSKGSLSEPSITMKRLASEYQVTFVTNAISVQMPEDTAPTQFTTKNWSANDTTLLGQALPMLGAAERTIINGKKFRRLTRKNYKNTAGFFNPQDNSINLMDDALPFDKDIWFGEGGKFYTRGIHTVLHEIGHAIHYSTVPATGTAPSQVMLEAFKTAVRSESQKRTGSAPGSQQFPPPGIDLPTDYSKKSWMEFFGDSYSIYKTNPAFLNTPKHKYLYDFFKNRFP